MGNPVASGRTASQKTPISGSGSKVPPLNSLVPLVREKRLQQVLQAMESRLPHSVRELAEQVHLSPAHLQRLFKQETGVHLSELLCERRLTMAAGLLTTTDMEIKEVAYMVGYGHHSSFVRAFQRRFGKSPKQYRRQYRNGMNRLAGSECAF
ncbi:MAG TPA: helix-turn-helix transcriptional regulator [Candidatus Angelobacter sp.]